MKNLKKDQNWQVGEVQLMYKTSVKQSTLTKIDSSQVCYKVFIQIWDENKIQHFEQSKILMLNKANKVIGMYEVSSGGVDSTVVDLRMIFSAALLANATAIILAHNHPSGNLTPSQSDIDLTHRIRNAGQIMNIGLIDHLIITTEGYYSFAEQGLL